MPLVRFLDAASDVIPQAQAVIEIEGEDKAAIWRKADVRDSRIVLVDERPKALSGLSVPYTTFTS